MPNYVLLLRNDEEAWKKLSPEEMQKKVEKYLAWRNKPFVVGGAGLVGIQDGSSGRRVMA